MPLLGEEKKIALHSFHLQMFTMSTENQVYKSQEVTKQTASFPLDFPQLFSATTPKRFLKVPCKVVMQQVKTLDQEVGELNPSYFYDAFILSFVHYTDSNSRVLMIILFLFMDCFSCPCSLPVLLPLNICPCPFTYSKTAGLFFPSAFSNIAFLGEHFVVLGCSLICGKNKQPCLIHSKGYCPSEEEIKPYIAILILK